MSYNMFMTLLKRRVGYPGNGFQYWDEKGKLPKEFNRVSDERFCLLKFGLERILCNSFCHKWSGAMLIEPLLART